MKRDIRQVLYLRLEPTTDHVLLKHSPTLARAKRDVVAYGDEACKDFRGRFPWRYSGNPKPGCASVILNCYSYRAVWLPEKGKDEK